MQELAQDNALYKSPVLLSTLYSTYLCGAYMWAALFRADNY